MQSGVHSESSRPMPVHEVQQNPTGSPAKRLLTGTVGLGCHGCVPQTVRLRRCCCCPAALVPSSYSAVLCLPSCLASMPAEGSAPEDGIWLAFRPQLMSELEKTRVSVLPRRLRPESQSQAVSDQAPRPPRRARRAGQVPGRTD